MSKKSERITTAEELFTKEITYKGNKYQPVTHKQIIEVTKEELYKANLSIVKEEYLSASNGQRAVGKYSVRYNDELDYMIAFSNSMDGSMSFRLATGSVVSICSNGCVFGDFVFKKKHFETNKPSQYILERTKSAIEDIEFVMLDHLSIKEQMQQMEVDKTLRAQLIGDLFLNEQAIQVNQLSVIKEQIDLGVEYNGSKDSLWTLFNHVTYAIHDATPISWQKQHQAVGNYFKSNIILPKMIDPTWAEEIDENFMGVELFKDI